MKRIEYLAAICFGLLLLTGIEGIVTAGGAYKFENYILISWIVQILLVTCTICLAVLFVGNDQPKSNSSKHSTKEIDFKRIADELEKTGKSSMGIVFEGKTYTLFREMEDVPKSF